MSPSGASTTQRPQAVQATSHCSSAVSPSALFLHAIHNLLDTGCSENRSLGQISTQSLQAVQRSASTSGKPKRFMVMASKSHTSAQSAKPRQPQAQALPPPPATAAARQEDSPW